MGLAAGAVFATCASVVVVALAFALYALVEPFWGRAGAAAVVAGAAALLMFLIAAVLMAGSAPPKPRKGAAPGPEAALDRVVDFLKERPYVAIAAAVAAGFLAIRDPNYVGSLIRAVIDPGDRKGR